MHLYNLRSRREMSLIVLTFQDGLAATVALHH